MNPLTLRILLALAPLVPEIVAELRKIEGDATAAGVDTATKVKNLVSDVELLLTTALKVL